jgi:hypothetical protein
MECEMGRQKDVFMVPSTMFRDGGSSLVERMSNRWQIRGNSLEFEMSPGLAPNFSPTKIGEHS